MNPFVTERLLTVSAGGSVAPSASAPDVKIDLVLKDIDQDDNTYGLHEIKFVLDHLTEYGKEAGCSSLTLSRSELLDPNQVETVDDLATLVQVRAQ